MIQLVRTLIGTIAALGAYVFLSVVVGILFSNAILAQTIAVLGASATFLLILFDNKKGDGNSAADHLAHLGNVRND